MLEMAPGVIFACEEKGLITIDCCEKGDFYALKDGSAGHFEIGFVDGKDRIFRHVSLRAKDLIEIRDFLSSVIDGIAND